MSAEVVFMNKKIKMIILPRRYYDCYFGRPSRRHCEKTHDDVQL